MAAAPLAPFIPRMIGMVLLALGFVCGLQGLDQPGSFWFPAALGLIVSGVLAQGYAFYCRLQRLRHRQDSPR